MAYDSTAGGLSTDGSTLVLINPRRGFPRATTTFAIFSARMRSLRLRQILRLRGDFSYDALSRDGRSLFLINYISPTNPTQYRVRVYDLARNRLDPKPIVDPREAPDEMNGFALARVTSRDGRWAYTLYQGTEGKPFIHALDTRDRKAVCIDLDDPALAGGNPYELRLLSAAREPGSTSAAAARCWRPSTPRRSASAAVRQPWRPRARRSSSTTTPPDRTCCGRRSPGRCSAVSRCCASPSAAGGPAPGCQPCPPRWIQPARRSPGWGSSIAIGVPPSRGAGDGADEDRGAGRRDEGPAEDLQPEIVRSRPRPLDPKSGTQAEMIGRVLASAADLAV